MSTDTAVKYATRVTGVAAPRNKNNDAMIGITFDHQRQQATFTCASEEHVGINKQSKVLFTAFENCTLHFTNPAVFGTDNVALWEGKQKELLVIATSGETFYDVTTDNALTASVTTEETVISPMVPPRIVVP
jgi:hypothetical protein